MQHHKKKRVGAGLSLKHFANAKKSGFDKRAKQEKERALNAGKVNAYRKLKKRLGETIEPKFNPAEVCSACQGVGTCAERWQGEGCRFLGWRRVLGPCRGVVPRCRRRRLPPPCRRSTHSTRLPSDRQPLSAHITRSNSSKRSSSSVNSLSSLSSSSSSRGRACRSMRAANSSSSSDSVPAASQTLLPTPRAASGTSLRPTSSASQRMCRAKRCAVGGGSLVAACRSLRLSAEWRRVPSQSQYRGCAPLQEAEQQEREERQRAAEARRQRLAAEAAARAAKSKAFRKRTAHGQPLMKVRVEKMLEQLQAGHGA